MPDCTAIKNAPTVLLAFLIWKRGQQDTEFAKIGRLGSTLGDRLRLKPWHWWSIALTMIVSMPLAWFILAYAALPRLWSHHEHKLIRQNDAITSYTAQDIPGDSINLRIHGRKDAIIAAYRLAGWSLADPVLLRTGVRIGVSVIAGRPYPNAPKGSLFVQDRVQDFAFEREDGTSADRRHHVRFWQIGTNDWLAAATFDRGVGLSLFTLQITHHIGTDIDTERALSSTLLKTYGAVQEPSQSMRLPADSSHRNGGGDQYRTDGFITVLRLKQYSCRARV